MLSLPPQAADWTARERRAGRRIGFVPTMGALHAGHIALVKAAREQCDALAVSIFVNPLQFNDQEDLARYPRQPGQDGKLLEQAGCDLLFMPGADALFGNFTPRQYDLDGSDLVLEGASRPGHFQGVVNVVERLFHYVRPDAAVFGEKDRQQLTILRNVAKEQRWPERILACPTVRAADGLALSSRNQRLSPEERERAPLLYRALQAVGAHAFSHSVADALRAGRAVLAQEPRIKLDYLVVARTDNLRPVEDWGELPEAVALIAAQVGPVRLIDNITLRR